MKQETEHTDPSQKVWFITGASRGLGRSFTEVALSRGHKVVALARDVSPLDDIMANYENQLIGISVDIADRAAVFEAVASAYSIVGRFDVVVNNAGQFLLGMVEEITEAQARQHMDVNFFGALWVCQAVSPYLRKQGSGHIIQVTTMGTSPGYASVGLYGAGKAALDTLSGALAMELGRFGVKVTIVQPGGYLTELFTRGITVAGEHEAYDPLREELAQLWSESHEASPEKASQIVMKLVEMEEPPKRIILGGVAYDQVLELHRAIADEYASNESLSREGD